MNAAQLCSQTVRIIDPHSPHYGKLVRVKAVQVDLHGQPSTVLVSAKNIGELEVKLADISTSMKRKLVPQTELFL